MYQCGSSGGRVAELADARDLGSRGVIRVGSTPIAPTNSVHFGLLIRFIFPDAVQISTSFG